MNDELSVAPPIDPAQTIQDMEARPKKKQKCGICKQEGHNSRNCPKNSSSNTTATNTATAIFHKPPAAQDVRSPQAFPYEANTT